MASWYKSLAACPHMPEGTQERCSSPGEQPTDPNGVPHSTHSFLIPTANGGPQQVPHKTRAHMDFFLYYSRPLITLPEAYRHPISAAEHQCALQMHGCTAACSAAPGLGLKAPGPRQHQQSRNQCSSLMEQLEQLASAACTVNSGEGTDALLSVNARSAIKELIQEQ